MMDCATMDMGSMMGWMMGLGLLAWVLVIGLLVTIVVLLIRILRRTGPGAPQSGEPLRSRTAGGQTVGAA